MNQADSYTSLDQVIQLLLDKQAYDRAAQLLLEAHKKAAEQADMGLAGYLLAAYQICVTCNQHYQDMVRQYDGYQQAIQREQELQEQLVSLLAALIQPDAGVNDMQQLTHSISSDSIWQRVRRLVSGEKGTLWKKRPSYSTYTPPTPQLQLNDEGEGETAVSSPANIPKQVENDVQPPNAASEPLPATTNKIEVNSDPHKPTLVIYCLGTFQVYEDDCLITNWPNGKGKAIFKYLVTNRHRPINKEILMELFWPDATPDAARNNLNVAIYGLRKALRNAYPEFSYVLFQNDCYLLNSEVDIWIDIEEFENCLRIAKDFEKQAQLKQAIQEYHRVEELYQGEFLLEDRYENWVIKRRKNLENAYLDVLEWLGNHYYNSQEYATCITLCQKFLLIELCHEETHRQLMRAYSHQNQHYLSIRQYHKCVENLKEELDVTPDEQTTQLYHAIRLRKPIS
ncbi:MAG: hypothetical protein GY943_05890 [Chloroflexi bacterium]|nr:hypothetical protein [Chloroflexota bacterium]